MSPLLPLSLPQGLEYPGFLFSRAWAALNSFTPQTSWWSWVCLAWKTQNSAPTNDRGAVQHLCTVQALPAIVSTICSAQCSEISSPKQPFILHFTLLGGLWEIMTENWTKLTGFYPIQLLMSWFRMVYSVTCKICVPQNQDNKAILLPWMSFISV